MDITALEGMDLISLSWSGTRLDLKAISSVGELWEATLSNPNQAKVDVVVHSLDLRLIYEQDRNLYSFGELETISMQDGEVHFEADAGYFSVRASKIFVQKLAGAGTGDNA